MVGTEKQGNKLPITCIYLPDKHRKMANALVKCGHYNNVSELVRENIERDYNEKIPNPREELKREKRRLEEVIKELEDRVVTVDEVLDSLVDRYKERKNNMPAKALGNYEKFSKNWINSNMDDVALAFPGKSIDDIYIELEKMINKGDRER